MLQTRKMLVTSALPYANGPLHLGHMVGYIQADIWVRFQKMLGHDCLYVCGSDSHGTPIMIQAEKMGITPETLISTMQADHEKDFAHFNVAFDNYYTTHSAENNALVKKIFARHLQAGNIEKHIIKQLFDPIKNMFLPDRYIKGECPNCGTLDQYGDNCEACGSTYSPVDLKNPYSTLTGVRPIEKESEHYFFKLQNFENFLKDWTRQGHLQVEVSNKLDEWFKDGLREWDISRDAPYFGFLIPGETQKYFYVWLDAPVGYMASFKNLCEKNSALNFSEYWGKDSTVELYHFIGKDIIYFHALFWPALLHGANIRTPTAVFVNGFLTINGQKMSKSRGTFIKAKTFLEHFDSEFLRYYFASKLNNRIEDLDINFDDFMQRVNADLVGKYINIASRTANFIHKHFAGKLATSCSPPLLYQEFATAGDKIATKFKNLDYSQAVREITLLADRANQYIDEKKPWVLLKDPGKQNELHAVCTMSLNLFRLITIYLKPILPEIAKQVEAFLNIPPLTWQDKDHFLSDHPILHFKPLISRIDIKNIEALKMAAQQEIAESNPTVKTSQAEEINSTSSTDLSTRIHTTEKENSIKTNDDPSITIDEFNKIDLRIAKIMTAETIEGSDKLLRLQIDLGEGKWRQILSGIRSAYQPEDLINKLVLVVANLAPRKMRFGMSEGMILVAKNEEDGKLYLVMPETGSLPGMKVK